MSLCECGCGKTTTIYRGKVSRFISGHQNTTHGHSRGGQCSPTFATWRAMRNRVSRPHYRSRGITVCERWLKFENFLADVGPAPSLGQWLERIDNDGHYEPGNVRWATIKEQCRNRGSNKIITAFGVSRCVAEWAETTGIPYGVLKGRLDRGWDAERALTVKAGQP